MTAAIKEGDEHIGHAGPSVPFHKTAYVSTLNDNVFIDNKRVIVVGDTTSCGDPAVAGSTTVFIDGRPVHRVADATGGHTPWVPNQADESDSNVFIGN